MSVQSITAALTVRGVSSSEKFLLVVLANYADQNMQCWPSHGRLAADTCMSQRNILRVLTSLDAKGLISRKPRYRANIRTTDMITLTLRYDAMSPVARTPCHSGGDTMSLSAMTPCHSGGDTMSPRTFIEPSIEPSGKKGPVLPSNGQLVTFPDKGDSLEERRALAAKVKAELGIKRGLQ